MHGFNYRENIKFVFKPSNLGGCWLHVMCYVYKMWKCGLNFMQVITGKHSLSKRKQCLYFWLKWNRCLVLGGMQGEKYIKHVIKSLTTINIFDLWHNYYQYIHYISTICLRCSNLWNTYWPHITWSTVLQYSITCMRVHIIQHTVTKNMWDE